MMTIIPVRYPRASSVRITIRTTSGVTASTSAVDAKPIT